MIFTTAHRVTISALIAIVTIITYRQVMHNEFINYDDDVYIYENPEIHNGFTTHSVTWAFTTPHAANWHPLTWLSHMLDCELFGLNPTGHHGMSLFIHTINAILLFALLTAMTGNTIPGAVVALLFALHPLNVESVAWAAERKNVLSTTFWFLTIGAYYRYVIKPGIARYACVVLFFLLGLMSKPMLVTLPFVLLLLDFWPLGRYPGQKKAMDDHDPPPGRRSIDRPSHFRWTTWLLVREKIPLIALMLLSCAITYSVQHKGGAVIDSLDLTIPQRFGNAILSYARYLNAMVWPTELAPLYLLDPSQLHSAKVLATAMALAIATIACIAMRGRCPYAVVGWLWYLGTLVPVIGIVQVGFQSHADRYTYVPAIGIYVLVAWALRDFTAGGRRRSIPCCTMVVAVAAVLGTITSAQVRYWRSGEDLFGRTVELNGNNYIARNNLGNELVRNGKIGEAMDQFRKTIEIKSDYSTVRRNLGGLLLERHYLYGDATLDEAIEHLSKAVEIYPDYAMARQELGIALALNGETERAIDNLKLTAAEARQTTLSKLGKYMAENKRLDESVEYYGEAIRINPTTTAVLMGFGHALESLGKPDRAIDTYSRCAKTFPDCKDAHTRLGVLYAQAHKSEAAEYHFRRTLELEPVRMTALNGLAWLLATQNDNERRNGDEALLLAKRAAELTAHKDPAVLDTLAAAYAEVGQFDRAVETAKTAVAVAAAHYPDNIVNQIRDRLELYKRDRPYRLQAVVQVTPTADGQDQ